MISIIVTAAVAAAVVAFLMWKFPKVRKILIGLAVALGAGAYAFWEKLAPVLGLG